jgi:hypothetical protein
MNMHTHTQGRGAWGAWASLEGVAVGRVQVRMLVTLQQYETVFQPAFLDATRQHYAALGNKYQAEARRAGQCARHPCVVLTSDRWGAAAAGSDGDAGARRGPSEGGGRARAPLPGRQHAAPAD